MDVSLWGRPTESDDAPARPEPPDTFARDEENEADSAEMGGMEKYACAFCGELNEIFMDRTAARRQQFTEDCEVCCRPNLVTVFYDPDGGTWIDAEQEYDA
jgi:hypothetical protein